MSTTEARKGDATSDARGIGTDTKLEVVVIPVSDVDRSKSSTTVLGGGSTPTSWISDDFRVVQFTPPGSGCSISFGKGVTAAAPGSANALELIVSDIVAARDESPASGIAVSEVFHGSPVQPRGAHQRPRPEAFELHVVRRRRGPDGNTLVLQEVTVRLPGRIDASDTAFASTADLASAMRLSVHRSWRARAANRTGR